jgi:hypothetical protein
MATNLNRQTAKIYQFPTRGRVVLSGPGEAVKPAAAPASGRVAKVEGSSWYHDAAVQEAEKARKH